MVPSEIGLSSDHLGKKDVRSVSGTRAGQSGEEFSGCVKFLHESPYPSLAVTVYLL
jgi:hypothetical protein